MPKLKKQKLNNNKSDISLKKINGKGKNTQERGFVAKLPKFNYDENGNTPVRKGGCKLLTLCMVCTSIYSYKKRR